VRRPPATPFLPWSFAPPAFRLPVAPPTWNPPQEHRPHRGVGWARRDPLHRRNEPRPALDTHGPDDNACLVEKPRDVRPLLGGDAASARPRREHTGPRTPSPVGVCPKACQEPCSSWKASVVAASPRNCCRRQPNSPGLGWGHEESKTGQAARDPVLRPPLQRCARDSASCATVVLHHFPAQAPQRRDVHYRAPPAPTEAHSLSPGLASLVDFRWPGSPTAPTTSTPAPVPASHTDNRR